MANQLGIGDSDTPPHREVLQYFYELLIIIYHVANCHVEIYEEL